MRERSVALIVRAQRLLTVHRQKAGQDYHVLPGGGIEPGETPVEACVREVQEETGLAVAHAQELCVLANRGRLEHYFLVDTLEGEPTLGGPEKDRNGPDDRYTLEWVDADRLTQVSLLPEAIRPLSADVLREVGA